MSENQRKEKVYGAVETDSHIVFRGFCKKIYSNEQQKVNIFINGKKIDTIEANKNIEEIEDKYEVFDTNNFCFEYEVPSEYLEEKYKLEFKTEDNNQLLNSPNFTTDKKEIKHLFFYSLTKPNNENKKIYKKNHISFFAIKENYTDEKFVSFIKDVEKKFEESTLVAYVFSNEDEKKISQIFKKLKIIYIANIKDLYDSSEIFISNRNYTFQQVLDIEKSIILNNSEINVIAYDSRLASTKLIDYEKRITNNYNPYVDDYKKLGISSILNTTTETICHQIMNLDTKTFKLDTKTFKDMCLEMINQSLSSADIKSIFIKANKLRIEHKIKKN